MISKIYGDNPKVAVLVKATAFRQAHSVEKHYINALVDKGVNVTDIMVLPLEYDKKKVSAKFAKEYLFDIWENLPESITTLLVADAEYFKILTKSSKAEPHHGYLLPCKYDKFEKLSAVLSVNFQAMLYNPDLQEKLDRSIQVISDALTHSYQAPGCEIIKEAHYPKSVEEIKYWLNMLYQYPKLTCDIEGFSLKFMDCGIGTISFAWNENCGIAFPVDLGNNQKEIRSLLVQFFTKYTGHLIYHSANFDIKVLVYQLFMNDLMDYRGMLNGIGLMAKKFHDTKLITYLATNRCGQQSFSLKNLAQEFAGNWAQGDIEDITLIPLDQLLQYNLVDCLSTWWVYNKYAPVMLDENQLDIYTDVFLPAVKVLLQTELVGMPIDPAKVQVAKKQLQGIVDGHEAFLLNNPTIESFQQEQRYIMAEKDNAARLEKSKTKKIKIKTWENFKDIPFNPGSGDQVRELVYEFMGYEAIDFTDTKQPSTKASALKKLKNLAKSENDEAIFTAIIGRSKANKVLTSFIPAFEQAVQLPDGSWRLYGNFNLGGTQSGRLSSSKPNLQNIPSGSEYADIIKECFVSGFRRLFGGADFTALEAMIEAMLSRDPNKAKIYIDGYDSHCFNAFSYFHDQMPDIVDTRDSVNSIKKLYPKLRQKSKAPTFALTYQGTWHTIMKSAGVSKEEAIAIEQRYKEAYKVSLAWLKGFLDKAHDDGYIEGCFGLKVRTPLLKRALKSEYKMPRAVAGERRSAGNAKTQSYGMLNTRATNEFMERVWASPFKYDIMPCAQIHDATYFVWADRPDVTAWLNKNLIDCMKWQELPELYHETIKLGAELDIYWPAWKNKLTLKNDMTEAEIIAAAQEHKTKIKEALNA